MEIEYLKTIFAPVSRLKIYQEAKKIILGKMNLDAITPERADEILSYVKKQIVAIVTIEQARRFYFELADKFPELKPLKNKFELEKQEKLEQVESSIIEAFMEKGDFETAQKIIDKIREIKAQNGQPTEFLKINFPDYFKQAILDITAKN